MKNRLILIGIIGLTISSKFLFAKSDSSFNTSSIRYSTSDTIYYLHDTTLVQKNDLKMKAHNGMHGKIFVIKCGCLTIGNGDIYLQGLKKKMIIDEQKMKSFKLITLSDLVSFVKVNNTPNFDDNALGIKHSVYIIEPSKSGYILHKVYNDSIDYEAAE